MILWGRRNSKEIGNQNSISKIATSSTDDGTKDGQNLEENVRMETTMANFLSGISANHERIHYIFREYEAVAKNPIEGCYITPGAESPLVWFGLLIVRTGIFYGGIFRFSITIPEEFPDTNLVPIVQFDEPLFHPLINSKDNCVDLSRFFPSGWQRDRNHIYQVITATQGIFFSCQCDSAQAANPEAAILLKENRHKFVQLAHDAVRRSRTQVYAMPNSEDQNAIRFTPWNEEEMEPYRLFLLGKGQPPENGKKQQFEKMGRPIKPGISWVKEEENWTFL